MNTKLGDNKWVTDVRPDEIEEYTETNGSDTAKYKLVEAHPIIGGILNKLTYFKTHVAAVWYNKLANKTLKDKLDEVDNNITKINNNLTSVDNTVSDLESLLNEYKVITDILDTRDDNQTPGWYMTNYPRRVVWEFKWGNSNLGCGGTYVALITIVPWTDKSGGYPKQIAFPHDNSGTSFYFRVGASDTSWGSWIAK